MNREILLAQRDDLLSKSSLLARRPPGENRRGEEIALGLITKLVDEDAKTPRSVAEASGHFSGGETIDEEGAQRLVLPMRRVGRHREPAREC